MNGYISLKQLKRLPPDDTSVLLDGTSDTGRPWALCIGNTDYPHLYLMSWRKDQPLDEKPDVLAISIKRFIDTVLGGFANDEIPWEPLKMDDPAEHNGRELWGNQQLTVTVHRFDEAHVELSYHRRDRAPIRDWRIGQRIKNEVCGPEWEGAELYPQESRLMDEANEYHIWCIDSTVVGRFPFGQEERSIMTQEELHDENTPAVQRDLPDDYNYETLAVSQEDDVRLSS